MLRSELLIRLSLNEDILVQKAMLSPRCSSDFSLQYLIQYLLSPISSFAHLLNIEMVSESRALAFDKIASSQDPTEHLRFVTYTINAPKEDQVQVRFLASAINPQDLLVLRDKYPVKPEFSITKHDASDDWPFDAEQGLVPGYDGVAQVVAVGPKAVGLSVGDLALPRRHGLGTWRTSANIPCSSLVRLGPKHSFDPRLAALVRMVLTPSYILLTEAIKLKPGDWIIQNAATGGIAQGVIQFARIFGYRTVNVIRDRPEFEQVQGKLEALGADIVVPEQSLASGTLSLPKNIKLALDSVGGRSGAALATSLAVGGTHLSYGFFGRNDEKNKPFFVPVDEKLIFYRDLKFRGFRLSQQLASWEEAELVNLWTWFAQLHSEQKLKLPELNTISWSAGYGEISQAIRAAEDYSRPGSVKTLLWFTDRK